MKADTSLGLTMEGLRAAMEGVHNYLPTPFLATANFEVNAVGLRENVAYHARTGPENMTIVVGGGYGEGWTLDLDEHRAVIAAAVNGGQGKMPVMAGVIGGYKIALGMARNAETVGADALIVFPPPGGFPGPEECHAFFHDLARSVHIGVVVFMRFEFWPEILRRLAEIPNVIGFFPPNNSTPGFFEDIGRSVADLVPRRLLWIAENEKAAVRCFPLGARAYSTSAAAVVPRASQNFWMLGVSGQIDQASEILRTQINPIRNIGNYRSGYGISGIKAAMEILGRAGGPVRPPGTQVAPEDRPAIAEILRQHPEARSLVAER